MVVTSLGLGWLPRTMPDWEPAGPSPSPQCWHFSCSSSWVFGICLRSHAYVCLIAIRELLLARTWLELPFSRSKSAGERDPGVKVARQSRPAPSGLLSFGHEPAFGDRDLIWEFSLQLHEARGGLAGGG